jgi:hypothetical protein
MTRNSYAADHYISTLHSLALKVGWVERFCDTPSSMLKSLIVIRSKQDCESGESKGQEARPDLSGFEIVRDVLEFILIRNWEETRPSLGKVLLKMMKYDLATPIDCGVWKDPQDFVTIHASRDEAWVYFRCWDKPGSMANYMGCLRFEGVWLISHNRYLNHLREYPNTKSCTFSPSYLVVNKSTLLRELKAVRGTSARGFNWRKYDSHKYYHYIVQSHDFFTNIVAAEVAFTKVTGAAAKFKLDV